MGEDRKESVGSWLESSGEENKKAELLLSRASCLFLPAGKLDSDIFGKQ